MKHSRRTARYMLWMNVCFGENHIIAIIYGAYAFQASYYYPCYLIEQRNICSMRFI